MDKGFERDTDIMSETLEITSNDMLEITNIDGWGRLPKHVCDGASCKRIKTPEDYHGFLLKYDAGSTTAKHRNVDEYEILDVRVGTIINKVTNETYVEGDVVIFDKGEEHEIYCEEEAYVYCVMTKSNSTLDYFT